MELCKELNNSQKKFHRKLFEKTKKRHFNNENENKFVN